MKDQFIKSKIYPRLQNEILKLNKVVNKKSAIKNVLEMAQQHNHENT